MQNEPNLKKVKLSVTIEMKKDYEQMDTWSIRKNEPKTNPNEPKTNPILAQKTTRRTQTNPIQTQFFNHVFLRCPIFPPRSIINRINRICCVWTSSISFDSAKMALYKGIWKLNKYGKKILKLLNHKSLSRSSLLRVLTGTLFAHSYVGIFVLNN
jgi:hypothetical protein